MSEQYSPLRISIPIGDPRSDRQDLLTQSRLDGIVRCCEIGGLTQTLLMHSYLTPGDLVGNAVNLGVGSGADIIAFQQLGLFATGVDDRSITQGFVLGAYCPVPEFTSQEHYIETSAAEYLNSVADESLSLITAFDTIPTTMWNSEMAALAYKKLRPSGKVIISYRDFSGSEESINLFFPGYTDSSIFLLSALSYYKQADWYEELLSLFPQDETLRLQVIKNKDMLLRVPNKRDSIIAIAMK